jgi:hypothetical protein
VRGTLGKSRLADSPPHPDRTGRCFASPVRSDLSPQAGRGDPSTRADFSSKPSRSRRAAPWFAGSLSNEHRALTGFDRLRAIRTSARSLPWPIPSGCPSSCRIFRCSPDRQLADIFRVFAFASHTPVLSNRWFSIGSRRPSTKLYCSATPGADKMSGECQKCTWQFSGNVPVLLNFSTRQFSCSQF